MKVFLRTFALIIGIASAFAAVCGIFALVLNALPLWGGIAFIVVVYASAVSAAVAWNSEDPA